MAGTLIPNGSIGDTNIEYVTLKLDSVDKGKHNVSLTNYNSTLESAIAAGSVVEVNGSLYKFTSDETILDTNSVSDGTVYIQLVPDGTEITALYTNTAPEWSDSKQGWYDPTVGNENYRYLEFAMKKASTVWSGKSIFTENKIWENDSYTIENSNAIDLEKKFFEEYIVTTTKYFEIKKPMMLYVTKEIFTAISTVNSTLEISAFFESGSTKIDTSQNIFEDTESSKVPALEYFSLFVLPCKIRIKLTVTGVATIHYKVGIASVSGQYDTTLTECVEEIT